MKHILCVGAFLVCFTTIMASPKGKEALVGGLTPVDNAKNDKDAEDGKHLLLKHLAGKMNADPAAYVVEVDIPDLKVYSQVVSGVKYHYFWGKECYTIKCKNDPKSNALCDKKKEQTTTKDVQCSASYWVQPWTNTRKFFEPEC